MTSRGWVDGLTSTQIHAVTPELKGATSTTCNEGLHLKHWSQQSLTGGGGFNEGLSRWHCSGGGSEPPNPLPEYVATGICDGSFSSIYWDSIWHKLSDPYVLTVKDHHSILVLKWPKYPLRFPGDTINFVFYLHYHCQPLLRKVTNKSQMHPTNPSTSSRTVMFHQPVHRSVLITGPATVIGSP